MASCSEWSTKAVESSKYAIKHCFWNNTEFIHGKEKNMAKKDNLIGRGKKTKK
jgi:hypothetical protein